MNAACFILGFREYGKEQGSQYRDNCNNNEEFDKSECFFGLFFGKPSEFEARFGLAQPVHNQVKVGEWVETCKSF